MVAHGRVQNGVVVLEDDVHLPDGTRVTVLPEPPQPATTVEGAKDRMSDEERKRIREIMDRIAALPIEGKSDPFSGADHDKVLYGKP
jgi:hypothetical protein